MLCRNFKIGRAGRLWFPAIVLIAASASIKAPAAAALAEAAFASPALESAALESADGASVSQTAYESLAGSLQGVWFAQKSKVSAFDPFVDYNEFQDNESERENVVFLKSGRLLSLAVFGGYEGMTWTMREIYGDSLSVFGGSVSFFFDLQMALQLQWIFPRTHYLSPWNSRPLFSSYGLDLKYYFKKQNLVKGIAALNPYVVCGPFLLKVSRFFPEKAGPAAAVGTSSPIKKSGGDSPSTAPAPPSAPSDPANQPTKQEADNTRAERKTGVRFGAGIEISLVKQVFAGLEINYSYVPLPFQNLDLSLYTPAGTPPAHPKGAQKPRKSFLQRAVEPDPPANLSQRRFAGDMVSVFMTLGVNF